MKKISTISILLLITMILTIFLVGSNLSNLLENCRHLSISSEKFPPDCSLQGYTLHTCNSCGHQYKSDFIEPLGHDITVKETPATCTTEASLEHLCLTCGYTYTTYSEPLGHDMKETVIEPTCSFAGYTHCECSTCGLTYAKDHVTPVGHDFSKEVIFVGIGRTGETKHTCDVCQYTYTSDYVWYSDIFTGAKGDGNGVLAKGVDVSYHNEEIDWEKVKSAGIDYVIIRAGYTGKKDVKFEEYYEGARAAGLDIGCYFYTYSTTVEGAKRDAEFLLNILKGKKFEYPIYFDMEDPSQLELSTDLRMKMLETFCTILSDNGFFPGLYTNNNWLLNYWHEEAVTTLYDVWYARYGSYPAGKFDSEYGMWQYTETGKIDGITGDVDLNYSYKDYPYIIKKYGYNGY